MNKPDLTLTIDAPAKINLHLAIKNRRPDGFHDLESIFLALAFGDTLYFEPITGDNTLEIHMEGENSGFKALPMEKNIIFRAVSLFRKQMGYNQGLRIRVEKRIPLGGGLGGGSSDAASTLAALNKLASDNKAGLLSRDSLAEMAAFLGSDIPFFLCETNAAWVSGRGEAIRPVQAPQGLFFVLVNGFPSETSEAFRLLDEFRADASHVKTGPETAGLSQERLIEALAHSPRNWPFWNDFLPVFQTQVRDNAPGKVYGEILGQLRDLGADFAGLSGAGSTCFGVFTQRMLAEKAGKVLLKIWNFVKITFPLAYGTRR